MVKVCILAECEACGGEAYIPAGQAIDSKGQPYLRHKPCGVCDGSGLREKWDSLKEFSELLDKVDILDAIAKPVSQYLMSRDNAEV